MNAIWHICCPQCGHETTHPFELHNIIGPEVIWDCEEEQGGCGTQFVVRPMASLEARIRVVSPREYSSRCTFKGAGVTNPIGDGKEGK